MVFGLSLEGESMSSFSYSSSIGTSLMNSMEGADPPVDDLLPLRALRLLRRAESDRFTGTLSSAGSLTTEKLRLDERDVRELRLGDRSRKPSFSIKAAPTLRIFSFELEGGDSASNNWRRIGTEAKGRFPIDREGALSALSTEGDTADNL